MKLSVRSKIILITISILCIAIGAVTLISARIFSSQYSEVLQEKSIIVGQELKSQLDRLLKLGIALEDLVGFDEQCKEIVEKHKDISCAKVVDINGKVLFHSDPECPDAKMDDHKAAEAAKADEKSTYIALVSGRKYQASAIPVLNAADKPIAAVVISLPMEVITEPITKIINYSAGIAAVSFAVAIVLLVLGLSLWVTNPLKRLMDAIQEIREKGLLTAKVRVDSRDEIGELAFTFNKMTEDLQRTTTSIDNLNREIAERKKAEARTAAYAREVEDINRELDDFTYVVSHDLKEPLKSIDAFGKFIENDYKEKLAGDGQDYLERIRANTTRMQRFIDDLLAISRIERSRNPIEEADIEDMIKEVKFRLEYSLKEKNVDIVINNKLPKLFCDRVRLTEVFANIISNAIKYGDKPKTRIEIGSEVKGDFHEFYIKDNGPGIEEKYFDRIFQIFQRLETKGKQEGSGAGLAIVKKIIQTHKGKIWITSKVGEGTTFYFTIPKEKDMILEKKKIGEILVDKNIVSREDIKKALKEQKG